MKSFSRICCLLIFSLAYTLSGSAPPETTIPADVVLVKALRTVDVSSQVVKVRTEYQLKNGAASDINHFVHTLTEDEAQHLSWMSATEGNSLADKKDQGAKLRISRASLKGAQNDFIFHKIELLQLLAPGQTQTLIVEYSLTGFVQPHPKEITQADNQFVLYNGNANVPSAYLVTSETTTVKTGRVKPLSFTEVKPSKYADNQLTYGSYEKTPPFTKMPVRIHFENNSPFLVATNVLRTIELSHWGGNIAVEELVELEHKGATLKGSFSRLDLQLDRRGQSMPAVKSFKSNLPFEARDIYYRDEIGNISTSNVWPRSNRLELELRPRFPIFGGWRTNYVVSYNVPTAGYLFSSGKDFALKFRLLGHLYDNAVVERLQLRIILPEMSKNYKLVTPYAVKRLPDELYKSYLDTMGRPVIVVEKENLINNHIQTFTLYYEFERVWLLHEPMLLVSAFGIIFLVAMIFFRLDFSIQSENVKQKEQHSEQKPESAGTSGTAKKNQ